MAHKHLPIEEPQPRFIRDHLSVNDIEGTKSKPLYKGVAKDILNARDIEGTAPKYERVKPKPYDLMNYSDVTSKRMTMGTKRLAMSPAPGASPAID
jgi:hypothetical protein